MSGIEQRGFEGIGKAAECLGTVGRPVFGGAVAHLGSPTRGETDDWVGDAEWARLQEEPLRARALLRITVLVLAILIGWATVAEVDEVTRGDARVVPSSQLQVVQSVDGGVVEALLVREGDVVDAGDVLVRVDPTRFVSSMLESRAESFSLEARAARLQALTEGTPFLVSAELEKNAADVVAHERRLYESGRAEMAAQLSIARDQLDQRRQEINEARARYNQANSSYGLVKQELDATRPLVNSGAVSSVEVLRLERELARLRGDREQTSAQIARLQSAITEATSKVSEVELTVRNQMRAELSETMSRLASLAEGSRSLADKVRHAEVRSPVRGTVKRLLVNTVGGVVQPGQTIVEIVPLDDTLILEARIRPQDIAFLRPGQQAVVKLTAYDFAIYGGLAAELDQISADTVSDEQGGAAYLVRVRTHDTGLGDNLPVMPGMMAEVDILTGKRTIMSYLLKPVLRAKANALSER